MAPRGVGTKLHDRLRKPDELRADLIANWNQYCQHHIRDEEVALEGSLRRHVDVFNFSIVWFETPQEILKQHERTKYFYRRFKLSPPKRPDVGDPPADVAASELNYITNLLAAYSDYRKKPISNFEDLASDLALSTHFKHSRYCFYSADALNRFSRDHFGLGDYNKIKKHIFDAVYDMTLAKHDDGFQCLVAVVTAAAALQTPTTGLSAHVGPADKKGLCHHLSNDGELSWCNHA